MDNGPAPASFLFDHVFPLVRVLVTWLSVGAIVFGGTVPYIPQYRKIKRTRDAEGFSTYVCLVLLLANILRICFWFGERYEWPLLTQSIIMTITMLVMVRLCVTVSESGSVTHVQRRLTDFDPNYFWKWSSFQDYLLFVGTFSAVAVTLSLLLARVHLFVQLLGFASLLTEAMLGMPQFWKNMRNKSVEGMSVQMVVLWSCGDVFKTVYFVVRSAPLQFAVCGGLQVLIDLAILSQVLFYKSSRRRNRIPSTSTSKS